MEENKNEILYMKAPELGPKCKEIREGKNVSLEQASELSGLSVEVLQKFEGGEYCLEDEGLNYLRFILTQDPKLFERYGISQDYLFANFVYSMNGKEWKGEDVLGEVIAAMDSEDEEMEDGEDEENMDLDDIFVKIPELGTLFKDQREALNISLEQASELSGIDIETFQKIENSEECNGNDLIAYYNFCYEHIPCAQELFRNFVDGVLADHGYTKEDFRKFFLEANEETDTKEEV